MDVRQIQRFVKQFLFCCCFALPVHSQDFSVGWELWYPYQFHNKEKQLTGVDIEIFNLIAQKTNISFSYVELPWKRHLNYIKTGMVDIAFGASFTEERAKTALFSIPYRQETVNLFVKKGKASTIKLTKLSDIIHNEFLIGVEQGYYYGDEYQQLIDNPAFKSRIDVVIDIEQNISKLMEGHLDGFLADPITMQAFAKKYHMENEFEIHSLPIYQSDIHIMLSKKTCNLAQLSIINEAIASLKQDGTLTKIIKRWSPSN